MGCAGPIKRRRVAASCRRLPNSLRAFGAAVSAHMGANDAFCLPLPRSSTFRTAFRFRDPPSRVHTNRERPTRPLPPQKTLRRTLVSVRRFGCRSPSIQIRFSAPSHKNKSQCVRGFQPHAWSVNRFVSVHSVKGTSVTHVRWCVHIDSSSHPPAPWNVNIPQSWCRPTRPPNGP